MNRNLTILTILMALALATPAVAFFEPTAVSARSRAMGETTVSVHDPVFAAFHNPAMLAEVGQAEVTASYTRPFRLSFTDFMYAGAAIPVDPKYGNVGVGISKFAVNYQDVDLMSEVQISLAHGFTLFEDYHSRVDLGWSLNIYSLELGESVSGFNPGDDTSVGLDLGFAMVLHKRARAGFQIKNVNNPMIGADEEERVVGGVAYEPYEGVVTTFEIDSELGEETEYHGGLDMAVASGFSLRAGVQTNPNRLTGGFGYSLENVTVEYGFSTGGGTLDSTHQFGLRVAWGGEAP